MDTTDIAAASVTINLDDLPGTAIFLLVIVGVAAVFSPYLRVKLRRSFAPVAIGIIAVLLLAGYASATGIGA
jgi:uncharacterized membrane protein